MSQKRVADDDNCVALMNVRERIARRVCEELHPRPGFETEACATGYAITDAVLDVMSKRKTGDECPNNGRRVSEDKPCLMCGVSWQINAGPDGSFYQHFWWDEDLGAYRGE